MSTKISNPYDKQDVLRALKNSYLKEDSSVIKEIHDWVKDFDMVVIDKNSSCRMGEINNLENHTTSNINKTILIIHKPSLSEKIFLDSHVYGIFNSIKYLENYDDLKGIIELDYCSLYTGNIMILKCKTLKIKENVKVWKNIYQSYIIVLKNTDGTNSIIINPYLNNPLKTPEVKEEIPVIEEKKTLEIDYETKYRDLKKKYKKLKQDHKELDEFIRRLL